MKSLEKWQFISFLSRMSAMAFGIIQSFVIIRILSVSDWGIVQLVVSIGASLGIYQHLGLASASSREIAASEKKTDIFKIFITSLSVRYLVTIPLSIGLYIFAPRIAHIYGFSEIVLPLRIYAGVIFLQGAQAVLNSVISGTKRFKELFIYQGAIAFISIIVYIPLVYYFKIMGFFYALLFHEGLKSFILFTIGFRSFFNSVKLPTKSEFIEIFKNLFSLGMAIYFVKILVINWEKAGPNLLGLIGNPEMLGIYSFALLYAKKLMNVSDSVTDVNLPVFSGEYAKNVEDFKNLFTKNFNKIFSMIIFFAMSAIYWAPQLISILVGSNKYDAVIPLLLPMIFAFIFYSLLDIIKSSVAIPAKLSRQMMLGFLLMLITTLGLYFVGREYFYPATVMAYSMLGGSFLGLAFLILLSEKKLKFRIFTTSHILLLIQALIISSMSSLDNIFIKIFAYISFVALYLWLVLLSEFISKQDLSTVMTKSLRILRIK